MKVIKLKVNDKQAILKICFVVSFVYCFVSASGFRLPEQSLNGTALNSAYIAGAYGADATYYNPANMSLGMESDNYSFALDGTMIFIPGFSFDTVNRNYGVNVTASGLASYASGHFCEENGSSVQVSTSAQPGVVCGSQNVSGSAKTAIQPVPKFFFKSRSYKFPADTKINWGISFTTPSGLSMDWDGDGGGFLDDVGIAMLEFNPVISVSRGDFIAFGAGFRAIYTTGSFNNTLYVPYTTSIDMGGFIGKIDTQGTTKVEQKSNGSAWGFGYNLAMTIRPFKDFGSKYLDTTTIAVTYRGKVSWDIKGRLSAKSYIYQGVASSGILKPSTLVEGYIGMDADLTLFADLPTILNIGIAQDFDNFRLEFVYERTFYSSARIFEFGYANQVFDMSNLTGSSTAIGQIDPESMLGAADYSAVAYGNGWKDADAFRLGLTYFGENYKFMGSLAYDMTPAPQGQFGIPDADAYMIGIGARKKFFDNQLDVGIGYSLALKDNRKSFIVSHDGFGQLHLLTIGVKYLW